MPWDPGMHCPCLLSACCMLGPSMGTRKGGLGEESGVGVALAGGKVFPGKLLVLQEKGLWRGPGSWSWITFRASGEGNRHPGALGIPSPETPSPTPAAPQPTGAEGQWSALSSCLPLPPSFQVRKLRPGERRKAGPSTREVGGRAWPRPPGQAF